MRGRVGGSQQGRENPLQTPPSARHGTFAEEGPPTLKACGREQTQHRDHACSGLTILERDRRTFGVRAGASEHACTHRFNAAGGGGAAYRHGGETRLTAAARGRLDFLRVRVAKLKEDTLFPPLLSLALSIFSLPPFSFLRRQRALKCPAQLRRRYRCERQRGLNCQTTTGKAKHCNKNIFYLFKKYILMIPASVCKLNNRRQQQRHWNA